ncbi:hypothetical protein C4571_01695 [Candidatus Parcubacteria bacterium]|nr:MAG: hypothetical protein C4571_01695 [Candidatus Parcubacteria bacterium]
MELLDRKMPDWRSKVDMDKLDMMSSAWGLLEQVFGSQQKGLETLGISEEHLIQYGFFPDHLRGGPGLTAAWRQELREKQEQIPAQSPEAKGARGTVTA